MTDIELELLAAWTDPGPRPDIHESMKAKLRREWPRLAGALDILAAAQGR